MLLDFLFSLSFRLSRSVLPSTPFFSVFQFSTTLSYPNFSNTHTHTHTAVQWDDGKFSICKLEKTFLLLRDSARELCETFGSSFIFVVVFCFFLLFYSPFRRVSDFCCFHSWLRISYLLDFIDTFFNKKPFVRQIFSYFRDTFICSVYNSSDSFV